MNRWIRRTVTAVSMATALALVPGAIALAQDKAPAPAGATKHHHAHSHGLLGEALNVDSLTPEQRTAIDGLIHERQSARASVREADARLLSQLAVEVEQASIDTNPLASALSSEDAAATAASQLERDTLNRLHALLTPAQQNQLVDHLEAKSGQARQEHHGEGGGHGGLHGRFLGGARLGLSPAQRSQITASLHTEGAEAAEKGEPSGPSGARAQRMHQGLESFRGDSFDAAALVHVDRRGERTVRFVRAMIPVLTPAQRATLAKGLRHRVERESRS